MTGELLTAALSRPIVWLSLSSILRIRENRFLGSRK